jgi:hypothetical protein
VDPDSINQVKATTERIQAGERVAKVKGSLAFRFAFAAILDYLQIICSIPPVPGSCLRVQIHKVASQLVP